MISGSSRGVLALRGTWFLMPVVGLVFRKMLFVVSFLGLHLTAFYFLC